MDHALTIEGAMKRFGSTQALAGAELNLRHGEWLGLLGPNGAGKTTIVRSVSGRVRLDGGEVCLFGTRLNGTRSDAVVRRRLGVVPQEIALYPSLSARENLGAFGSLNGVRDRELRERVEWALAWTGLAERADEPIKRFSGGMKRRLNIACSVLHRPPVILLDEPTVGVDPQSRQRIWEMLEELRKDGASLLLTTHQLDEAQLVCDRIVIIDHGKTISAGTFAELVQQTIGAGRRVTLTLDGGVPASLRERGFQLDNGDAISRQVTDIVRDLPAMLEEAKAAGAKIRDIQIEAPSLQAVFLHLTGRELRE